MALEVLAVLAVGVGVAVYGLWIALDDPHAVAGIQDRSPDVFPSMFRDWAVGYQLEHGGALDDLPICSLWGGQSHRPATWGTTFLLSFWYVWLPAADAWDLALATALAGNVVLAWLGARAAGFKGPAAVAGGLMMGVSAYALHEAGLGRTSGLCIGGLVLFLGGMAGLVTGRRPALPAVLIGVLMLALSGPLVPLAVGIGVGLCVWAAWERRSGWPVLIGFACTFSVLLATIGLTDVAAGSGAVMVEHLAEEAPSLSSLWAPDQPGLYTPHGFIAGVLLLAALVGVALRPRLVVLAGVLVGSLALMLGPAPRLFEVSEPFAAGVMAYVPSTAPPELFRLRPYRFAAAVQITAGLMVLFATQNLRRGGWIALGVAAAATLQFLALGPSYLLAQPYPGDAPPTLEPDDQVLMMPAFVEPYYAPWLDRPVVNKADGGEFDVCNQPNGLHDMFTGRTAFDADLARTAGIDVVVVNTARYARQGESLVAKDLDERLGPAVETGATWSMYRLD